MSYRRGSDQQPQPRIVQTQTAGNLGSDPILVSEQVPSSQVKEIAPILRVANEVEASNKRVAYLCRFYAFEKSHRLDPTSSGRGVRQFRTALLQRLERENDTSLAESVKSDAREMQSIYRHYYEKYIQALQNAADKDRAQLTEAYHTTAILYEVLKAVNPPEGVDSAELDNVDEMISSTMAANPQGQSLLSGKTHLRSDPILDIEMVPSSLVEIAPILCVANEVESSNKRVAYLLHLSVLSLGRWYAFEKAHKLDPTASGRGVRKFKTSLLQRIERESETTWVGRAKSDAREMQSFYQHYYQKYIQASHNAADKDRAQLRKSYQTAAVLFEVLKAFNPTEGVDLSEVDALTSQEEVELRSKIETLGLEVTKVPTKQLDELEIEKELDIA